MAMINCPECKKDISSEASKCPNCGYDFIKAKKKKQQKGCAIGCLGVFAFFFIIGIIASQSDKSGTTQSSSSQSVKPQVITANIGDVVEVDNFVYRVEDIAYRKSIGNEFVGRTADGIYLLVKLSLKNIDSKEHTLDNSLFKLVDPSGTEYETSSEGSTSLEMSGVETLFLKSCNPNIQKVGYLIFEVPTKGVYHLKVSGGFWSGKTGDIQLTQKSPNEK